MLNHVQILKAISPVKRKGSGLQDQRASATCMLGLEKKKPGTRGTSTQGAVRARCRVKVALRHTGGKII